MRVLVLGSGAREHAIAARFASAREAAEVLCAPGNPGMAAVARLLPLDLTMPDAALDLARQHLVDFTVVGPELPLSLGVVDRFAKEGRSIFGPTQVAAQLESSKAFAKAFMARHAVPTAQFRTCDSVDNALTAIRSGEFGFPVVVKADGLAAGKGVVIAEHLDAAEDAINAVMRDRRFGRSGDRVVIEECLEGPEVSFFAICDGERSVAIGSAQDHKRIFDGDRGPNTGGMGAFAPSPLVDRAFEARVMRNIVEPVVAGMAEEGYPYRGFLFVGLMVTSDGPKVIEFNVRLGDPETQVVLPLIDERLLPLLVDAASGRLRARSCSMGADKLVGVVIASRGYPESSESGQPIAGIDDARQVAEVFHAGTAMRGGVLVTAGGRVLTVVGRGPSFDSAIARAYDGVAKIHFDGMQFRTDIGRKAVAVP